MKQAHTYSLKAVFEDGRKWDLEILASEFDFLSAMAYPALYCKDAKTIVSSMEVKLIHRDSKTVDDTFQAMVTKTIQA